ncbi:MAG: hypothetical protein Aurels2KO_30880 [Aureliella sp.]
MLRVTLAAVLMCVPYVELCAAPAIGADTATGVTINESHGMELARRPNFVFCMADDWSWPHASILGAAVVRTPNFDRIAAEGALFEHAFVSTPSCTPSRLSILTGQHHWRLQEGDSLGGSLREEFPVYTELLAAEGYRIGRFGKGVWPSKHKFRKRDSFGERFSSLDEFLDGRKPGQPFCYWHGGQDPHRPYEMGVGAESGMDIEQIDVPACLPDNDIVRSDLADYLWEVQRFDREVGAIIATLERIGELENTIVVVSGDNGMPFPRCKATLYDLGTRVPLAIRWGDKVSKGRTISSFVSLCDIAPTFLEAAGIEPPQAMTGRSLIGMLLDKPQATDAKRSFGITGMEKHVYSYPSRAIRTERFLFIRNFDSDDWPSGEVAGHNPRYDFGVTPWPTEPGAFSFNIDPSPSKQELRLRRAEPSVSRFAGLSFLPRAAVELYVLSSDPDQLTNVADVSDYAADRLRLRRMLDAELIKTSDPRLAVAGYESRDIEGWPVRVSTKLRNDAPQKVEVALTLIAEQLQTIVRAVPPGKLARLRTVPIWISPKYPGVRPTGEYHPSAGWLKKVGRPPELVECIELTNIDNFAKECKRMPMLLMHELAHAYHHQVLGFDAPEISAAYQRAVASGSYDAVERHNGRVEKAYAMNNSKEYFAESTEAYLGTNDFFPFNKQQLQTHDPNMHQLLERIWGQN